MVDSELYAHETIWDLLVVENPVPSAIYDSARGSECQVDERRGHNHVRLAVRSHPLQNPTQV